MKWFDKVFDSVFGKESASSKDESSAVAIADPIQEAIKLCGVCDSTETLKSRSTELKAESERLRSRLKNVLGCETDLRSELEGRVTKLDKERENLDLQSKFSGRYKLLSKEIFNWRKKVKVKFLCSRHYYGSDYISLACQLPTLAIFSLDRDSCDFSFNFHGGKFTGLNSSPGIFTDMKWPNWRSLANEMLRHGSDFNRVSRISLTSKLKTVIPDDVKQKIQEAREDFKNEIYIIAEANWEGSVQLQPKDPLVVGWDGHNFWLIAVYDPTTIEKYIADEFSSSSSSSAQ